MHEILVVKPFSAGPSLVVRIDDVYKRQILTSEDGLRTDRIKNV